MNRLIENLPLIAQAAEFYDKSLGAEWKIKNAWVNPTTWAANKLLSLEADPKTDEADIDQQIVLVASLRRICAEINNNVTLIDFTPKSVAQTLGLNQDIDFHAEACRLARQRCMAVRSAVKFKEFYNKAYGTLAKQHETRAAVLERLVTLLNEDCWSIDRTFYGNGYPQTFDDPMVPDEKLYDENLLEPHFERFQESLANILESMFEANHDKLSRAVTDVHITKYQGFEDGIVQMMQLCGINQAKMTQRSINLQKDLDKLSGITSEVGQSHEALQADVERQALELMQAAQSEAERAQSGATPLPGEPIAPIVAPKKRHLVKSAKRLAREAQEHAAPVPTLDQPPIHPAADPDEANPN